MRDLLKLALPLVAAELGWMCMGLEDTMMVGHMSNSALSMGAVSLGDVLFFAVAITGVGVMLGLDTLVSQAFGAGRLDDCHRSLWSAVYLALPMAALSMGVVRMLPWILAAAHTNPQVLPLASAYMTTIYWCTLPLILFNAFRRYLQGINLVKPITFALVSANLLNLGGNWMLIYGHWGFPAMGVVGSAWSTCIARTYLFVVLAGYAVYHDLSQHTGMLAAFGLPEWTRIAELLRLGVPAAGQIVAEIGVFALSTAMIARLDPVSLAGHQITISIISLTFMVPLGISAATAVRVGQSLGAGNVPGAEHAGYSGMLLGAAFMSCSAIMMWTIPHLIARMFTPDPAVISMGAQLLKIAAFFQIFDAMQVISTGALRGAGDTRIPMLCHAIIYWGLGLPLGYTLCFHYGWGAPGIWIGLSLAVIVIGLILFTAWRGKVRTLKVRTLLINPG